MTKIRRRIGHYIKKEGEKIDFTIHTKDFNQECYEELEKYIQIIWTLQPILISYDALILSYTEMLTAVEKHRIYFLKEKIPSNGYMISVLDCLVESTQKVTNVLSSATSLLTTSEIKLKKESGGNSEKYNIWNEYRKSCHSDNFSYRILYELRNYSQHSNIPIGEINIQLDGIIENNPRVITNLNLSKESLLNSGYNWKSLEDIKTLEDKTNILPLIENYIFLLKKITLKFLEVYDIEIDNCHRYMTMLKKTFKFPNSSVPVIFIGETISGQPVPNKVEHIPIEQLTRILSRYSELKLYLCL